MRHCQSLQVFIIEFLNKRLLLCHQFLLLLLVNIRLSISARFVLVLDRYDVNKILLVEFHRVLGTDTF